MSPWPSGFSLLVAAYAIGSISGCHINPAVTLGLWVIGKTKSIELPYYIVGQVVGGLVGALIIFVIAKGSLVHFSASASGFASNGYGAHSPGGFKLSAVMLDEVVFTGIFVFIIASTSRLSMPVGMTGVTVGLTLTVIHLITIPVDNTSVNPARSLSTAVFQGGWALDQLWVFIVFPSRGGHLGRRRLAGPAAGLRRAARGDLRGGRPGALRPSTPARVGQTTAPGARETQDQCPPT